MRTWPIALLLLAACGEKAHDTETSSRATTASKSSASAKTSANAVADGPVFKAKVMGSETTKRLVKTPLDEAKMPGYFLQAPEGAEVRVGSPGGGAEIVMASVNYSISIREETFDAGEAKKIFNLVDPDGKVLTDTPDLVVYQRKSGSVLFGMSVSVGGKKFRCGSVATAFDFDRETVDQTVASCKTLEAAGAPASASASATPSAATPSAVAGERSAPPVAPPATKTASASTAKKAPAKGCGCAKNDLLCNTKCAAH